MHVGNRNEHHTTFSELGFTVQNKDIDILNEYHGVWTFTGESPEPNNWWLVTAEGEGMPVTGHPSPQQILDEASERGVNCAYVAPYGRYVIGALDGVRLHDWIRDRREKHKHQHH